MSYAINHFPSNKGREKKRKRSKCQLKRQRKPQRKHEEKPEDKKPQGGGRKQTEGFKSERERERESTPCEGTSHGVRSSLTGFPLTFHVPQNTLKAFVIFQTCQFQFGNSTCRIKVWALGSRFDWDRLIDEGQQVRDKDEFYNRN